MFGLICFGEKELLLPWERFFGGK